MTEPILIEFKAAVALVKAHNSLTHSDIADKIGLNNVSFKNMLLGRKKIPISVVGDLKKSFPEVFQITTTPSSTDKDAFPSGDPYEASEEYERLNEKIEQLQIEIKTLEFKKSLIKEKFGGEGWSALD